ncbi:MAG: NADH-ubiquinone/plastoquinone oxidoreductase chain 6 [Myxococcales bacterium]|nr:NADH-ubiquinone/plastoquinone oxidoreductase chain 6 [Myxococcales bacterium]
MIASMLWQSVQPMGRVTAQLATGDQGMQWSGPQIWWWIIAVFTVGGAISTVTRRNNIAAVMSLVATFFGLAAMYAMLSAHFLAALQVLVYAGAIMTLFVFVIMVLNRDEAEPWAWSGIFTKIVGVFALVYLVTKVGYHLFGVAAAHPETPPAEFGTVAQVGEVLFTDYLFVFEAVSVLLLIAVVAAVVVARQRGGGGTDDDDASADITTTPAVGHSTGHEDHHS